MPAGKGGSRAPFSRRSTAASRIVELVPERSLKSRTWPSRLTVKRTVARPSSPRRWASSGYLLFACSHAPRALCQPGLTARWGRSAGAPGDALGAVGAGTGEGVIGRDLCAGLGGGGCVFGLGRAGGGSGVTGGGLTSAGGGGFTGSGVSCGVGGGAGVSGGGEGAKSSCGGTSGSDAGCGTGGAGSGDASNAGAAVAAGENTTVMASGVGWLGGAAWRAIRASASAKQTWTATEPISGQPTCGGRLPGRTTSSRGPADRTGGPKAKPASASLDVIFVIL